MRLKNFIKLFIVFLFCLAAKNNQATWILGGDIQYEDLGGDTFRVTVNVYRDCNGINMSNRAIKFSGACSGITQSTQTMSSAKDITPTCPNQCTRCKSRSCSFQYGIEKRQLVTMIYLSNFTSIGCCKVNISWEACCRSKSITTGAASSPLYIEAEINACINTPNNSPKFSSPESVFLCLGRDHISALTGIDSDTTVNGNNIDSTVYSLNSPLNSRGSRTPWTSPYNSLQPVKYLGFPKHYNVNQFPFGFHFDSTTAQLMFRPMSIQQSIMGIKVEQFRNGVSVGYITRDLALIVIKCPNNNPPVLSGTNCSKPIADNFVIDACVGQEICFTICTSDKDRDDTVKLSWNKGIQNANFNIINKGNRREHAQFCYTPTKDDLKNSPLRFTVTAQDNSCPIIAKNTRYFSINITEPQTVNYVLADTQQINGCGMIQLSGHSLDSQKSNRISWYMNDSVFLRSQTNVDTFSFDYNLNSNGPKPIRLEVKRKGCLYNFYDTISLSGIKPISIPLTDTAFCFDYDLFKRLKAKGGADSFTYRWMENFRHNAWDTTGDSIAINLSTYYSGQDYRFYVEAIDTTQCTITDSFNVYLKRIYNPYIQISDTLICDSNQMRLLPVSTDTLYKANWDGIGVKNNVFSNVGIPSGQTYTLYYKGVEDDYCFYQEIDIKNYRRPVVSAGNDFVGCSNMKAVQLYGHPRYGVWTGKHLVSSGNFTPPKYLDSSYWFTYTYTSNNGCSASDSINLRIVDKPHNLRIGADSTVCVSDGLVQLNANLKGGFWYGNAFKKGNDYYFDPTNKITDSAYALFYNYEDSVGCKSLASKHLKVHPSMSFSVANDTQFCFKENEIITLNATPIGGLWQGKNISQSSGFVVVDSSLIGINSYTYSITDSFNCKYLDSTQVKVSYQPVIDVGQDDTLCISGKYRHVFKPNKLGGNWTGPGIINPNINSVTIDLETITPATYTYSYTNGHGCGDSDTVVLFIGKRATSYHKPSVTSGEVPLTVNFKNLSSAHSYNWDFGDGNASTDKEPSHTFNSPGTFKVVLVAKDSTEVCSASSSSTIEVDKTGNIVGLDHPELTVYPTLLQNELVVENETKQAVTIVVYDALGKMILNKEVVRSTTLSTAEWNAGTYFYKISSLNTTLELGKLMK